jgi:serine/threonine protein kinase
VTTTPAIPQVGAVLQGRYRLIAALGEGAMGSVFRGERVGLGRPVAIKFLHPVAASDPSMLKRFEVEARAMARLAHPNCVSVIDFGVEGLPYLVIELAAGVSLRTIIDDGPLETRRALALIQQVLAALVHAHARGIVHRDIKPENVIVEPIAGTEVEHVRVLDFGLAKLLDGAAKLTMGLVLGTPHYMPPEQMGDAEIDARADIYTTGIVLFEMLTAQRPFDGATMAEVFLAQKEATAPALSAAAPDRRFSPALETLVRRALEKAPADRFPSAEVMLRALQALPEMGLPNARVAPAEPTIADIAPWGAVARNDHGSDGEGRLVTPITPVEGLRLSRGVLWQAQLRRSLARPEKWWSSLSSGARWGVVGGLVSCLLLLLALSVERREPSPEVRALAEQPEVATSPATPPTADPSSSPNPAVDPKSDPKVALARLRELQRQNPKDARYPAGLARLAFEQGRHREGMTQFRTAVRLDKTLRGDPQLVGHVIARLGNDAMAESAEQLLKDLGRSAKPLVAEAATKHADRRVRSRARKLLEDWDKKPFLRWL